MKRNRRKGDSRPRKRVEEGQYSVPCVSLENPRVPANRKGRRCAPSPPRPLLPRLLSASFNDKIRPAGSNVSDTVASVRRASSATRCTFSKHLRRGTKRATPGAVRRRRSSGETREGGEKGFSGAAGRREMSARGWFRDRKHASPLENVSFSSFLAPRRGSSKGRRVEQRVRGGEGERAA